MEKLIEVSVFDNYLRIKKLPQIVSGDKNIVKLKYHLEFLSNLSENSLGTINIIDKFGSILSITNSIINNEINFVLPNELFAGENFIKIQLKIIFKDEELYIKDLISFNVSQNLLDKIPQTTEKPQQVYLIMLEHLNKQGEEILNKLTLELNKEIEFQKEKIKEYIEEFFIYTKPIDIENIIDKYSN